MRVTAVSTFRGITDEMVFDAELDESGVINTKRQLVINGFADGRATWNHDHYGICLYVHDEERNLAGIVWDDRDTMTAKILGDKLRVGKSFEVKSAHGDFDYKITAISPVNR